MKRFILLLVLLTFAKAAISQQVDLQELLKREQYRQVISTANELQPADLADSQTMYLIGQAYEGLMKYRDAYRVYQRCLSIDSTQTVFLNAAARMAAQLGKLDDAEAYFLKIRTADTTDFNANIHLAQFYTQIGKDAQALEYYWDLLENDRDNPAILRAIGDCCTRMNDKVTACDAYWFAFQNNKENAALASTLINALLAFDGRIDAALEVCDTALFYNPGNNRLWQNKGTTFYFAKKYVEADSIFTKLLAEGDTSFYTYKYGGYSRLGMGKIMAAIELLEKAYSQDSTAVDLCLFLGSALGKTYDRKEAFKLFDRADSLMQPNENYVRLLRQFRGDTYVRDGRIPDAYRIWLESKDITLLDNIWQRIGHLDWSKVTDNEARARCLFINVLVAEERAGFQPDDQTLKYARNQLEQANYEMYQKKMKSHSMIAPDNQKSTITSERLEALIQLLPKME
ncbi:MAG: hypothetical protein LBE56_14120 [Tannerella sp.]|nr:hypothetical protein [Tannerella sp.]